MDKIIRFATVGGCFALVLAMLIDWLFEGGRNWSEETKRLVLLGILLSGIAFSVLWSKLRKD